MCMGDSQHDAQKWGSKKQLNQAPFHVFQTKKQYICEKLAGQRKYSLERNLSEIWVFVSEESKRSLALGGKGLTRLVCEWLFDAGFYNSCDKVVSQSWSGEGTYHEDLFPDFRRTEESQRLSGDFIWNNQYANLAGLAWAPTPHYQKASYLQINGFSWTDSQRRSPRSATKKSIPSEALHVGKNTENWKSLYSELLTSSQSPELSK